MRLGVQNLLQDKLRFALSVAGIALAVMLILFLLGLRSGIREGWRAYLNNAPGSVAVLPAGVTSTLAGSGQFLPAGTADAVAGTPGVARVTPVLQTMANGEFHGKKEIIFFMGYDPALGGGPWDITAGRAPAADDEVVLDRVFADRHDFAVGDAFDLGGRTLKVVGLSKGTSSLTGSYVFGRLSLVESYALAPGAASLVLVTPAPGTTAAELVAALRQRLPGANVLLKRQVIANDVQLVGPSIDQIFYLMIGAAFVVGALVVGMVLYTATLERRAEYGILKAIGARGGVLYRVVVAQAVVAAGLGVALGVALAYAMGWLVVNLKPSLLVSIAPAAIAVTLGAGVVMALFGALVPARSVVRLAPADVFRR